MSLTTLPKTQDVSLAYTYQNGRYINLTSRCPTACAFCIKFSWDYLYRGNNLKLKSEPSEKEILEAAGPDLSIFEEVVFCGYGESTYRLKEMEFLAGEFRARGARRLRLNTIGLGNLIHDRNIVPDLARFLDAVSISLNTLDPRQYVEIHRPLPEYRDRAFQSACDFARSSAAVINGTTVTSVNSPGIDTEAVRAFADSIGAAFRLRPHLDEYENQ
jgi:TatD DNase family protein